MEPKPKTKTPKTGGSRKRAKKAPAMPSLPLPGPNAFKTRERANEGHRLPLHSPEGELTGHFIQCRGIDSDEFQRAQSKQTRRTAEIAELPEGEREEAVQDAKLEMAAALVADWSFSDPKLTGESDLMEPTRENVKAFLREAPQILRELDRFSSSRSLFFRIKSGN